MKNAGYAQIKFLIASQIIIPYIVIVSTINSKTNLDSNNLNLNSKKTLIAM